MVGLDSALIDALDRFYEKVEDRFGRAVAWLVTLTLSLAVVGALTAIFMSLI